MGSSGKKRTTMAKLNRESKLREKRADKEARKTARKLTSASSDPALAPSSEETAPPYGTTLGNGVATSDQDASSTLASD